MTYEVVDGSIKNLEDLGKDIIEPSPFLSSSVRDGSQIKIIKADGVMLAGFIISKIDDGVCAIGCLFKKSLGKHILSVKKIVEEHAKTLGYKEFYAQCIYGWDVGDRFMKFMGFEDLKIVETDPTDGVKYKIYRRK